MSRKQASTRAFDPSRGHEIRTIDHGTDNVCSDRFADSDSESAVDSNQPVRRRVGRPSVPLADRFWSKVRKGDGCWLWTSNAHHNGYGQIALSRNGATRQRWAWAHRVAWELTNGPIPAGQLVLHRCDTPLCVNPAHLFLGTHLENIADSVRKGRYNAWRRTGYRLNGQPAKPLGQAAQDASSVATATISLAVPSASRSRSSEAQS